jgi:endo-1,4-beta-xylanase
MIGSLFLAALISVQAVFAVPTPGKEIIKRQSYSWQNWNEGSGSWVCTNGAGGIFSARWTGYGAGGFVCGKGWTPGGSR